MSLSLSLRRWPQSSTRDDAHASGYAIAGSDVHKPYKSGAAHGEPALAGRIGWGRPPVPFGNSCRQGGPRKAWPVGVGWRTESLGTVGLRRRSVSPPLALTLAGHVLHRAEHGRVSGVQVGSTGWRQEAPLSCGLACRCGVAVSSYIGRRRAVDAGWISGWWNSTFSPPAWVGGGVGYRDRRSGGGDRNRQSGLGFQW